MIVHLKSNDLQQSVQNQSHKTKLNALNTTFNALDMIPIPVPEKKDIIQSIANRSDQPYILRFSSTSDLRTLQKEYSKHPDVSVAELIYPIKLYSTSSSYLFASPLKELYGVSGTHPVKIAVIDTGVNHSQSSFANKILINTSDPINGVDDDKNGFIDDYYGYDFLNFYLQKRGHPNPLDPNGHGTYIASIIAASESQSIIGIHSNSYILNIKFTDSAGNGNQIDAALAIRYAVDRGVQVINCSWGFFQYNTILKEAIEYAHRHNVTVLAAAGNSAINKPMYPAGFNSVISVSSISAQMNNSAFSNYGDWVDFSIYGENIPGLAPSGLSVYRSGTSSSVALMSGFVAKILSFYPNQTPKSIYQFLVDHAQDLGSPGKDPYFGYGTIDANKAKQSLLKNSNQLSKIQEIPITTTSTESSSTSSSSDSFLPYILGIIGGLLVILLGSSPK